MIPRSHKDILETPGIAHVATLGPGGEPHSTPDNGFWQLSIRGTVVAPPTAQTWRRLNSPAEKYLNQGT